VAKILQMLQFTQHHGMAQVKIGAVGPRRDRRAGGFPVSRIIEVGFQLRLRDDFGDAFFR